MNFCYRVPFLSDLKILYHNDILASMKKSVLIAGKEENVFEYVQAAAGDGYEQILLGVSSKKTAPEQHSASFIWNRSSLISARSFALEAIRLFETLDTACLIFDMASYVELYKELSGTVLLKGLDSLFLSYFFLSTELLHRFSLQGGGTLCFIFENYPSLVDSQTVKNISEARFAGPLVASAAASFCAFAENTFVKNKNENITIHLIERNFKEKDNIDFAPWFFNYVTTFAQEKAKQKRSEWIQYGAKARSAWGLFGR